MPIYLHDRLLEDSLIYYGETNACLSEEAEQALQVNENEHIPEKISHCRTVIVTCVALSILSILNGSLLLGTAFVIGTIIPIGLEKGLKSRRADLLASIKRTELPIKSVLEKMQGYVDELWQMKIKQASERLEALSEIISLREADQEKAATKATINFFKEFDQGVGLSVVAADRQKAVCEAIWKIDERSILTPLGKENCEKFLKSCKRYLSKEWIDQKFFKVYKDESKWKVCSLKVYDWDVFEF